MPNRATTFCAAVLAALGVGFALVPASAQQIHRHGFGGKQTALARGDANVRTEEKEHDISALVFKSQPSSEHLQIVTEAGTGDTAFVHYSYDTPPAPVSPALTASVWVKATKPGTQFRARVVFPKEQDPARPESMLTMIIVGKSLEKARAWEKLTLDDVPGLVGKHLPALQAKLARNVNTADAYIDKLILNVYSGPGPVDVWVDDLDIGPVKDVKPDGGVPGVPAKNTKNDPNAVRIRQVQQRGGQLYVEGKPHFFRAIRHTGTPLHVLRAAGFDSLWLSHDAALEVIEEANREGWFVIPSAPRHEFAANGAAVNGTAFDQFRLKFSNTDVLFWDLGGGLTDEQQRAIHTTVGNVRSGDRKRPIGGDLWDGFGAYSQFLDLVGAHRWPLFTSLELTRYGEWLSQRRDLTNGRPVFWTWVQNHVPEWYVANMKRPAAAGGAAEFADPIGPHPEQVRQLAYLSLACGARGLGFWSDRSLADTQQGRDRLQGMALLNAELDLISPVLLATEPPVWRPTNHEHVKTAYMKGMGPKNKGSLLIPIWLGPGDQYVPAQGAVKGLKITVPTVPEGHDPWLITPAGPENLRTRMVRTPEGTELTLDEFDLAAPIVFTDDQGANGLVVWWQDHARRYGRLAAIWSLDLAKAEYEKIRTVHMKLAEMGRSVRGSERLFEETQRYYTEAQKHFANEQYDKAYREATRALRPLRIVMRDHWKQAADGLDTPTASPFAVSYFSLPQHWELAREVQSSQVLASRMPLGNFEVAAGLPPEGVSIDKLPGWSARTGSLETDRVAVAAGIVPTEGLADPRNPREHKKLPKTFFSSSRPVSAADEGYVDPAPELGTGALKLEVRRMIPRDANGKEVPTDRVLERTFLAVDSPVVKLPAGTLVRVSCWIKTPLPIQGDAAGGVLFYDDAGGEPLSVRTLSTEGRWKQFHLYRRVPASGQIAVTLALTGTGIAYFDDLRLEPLAPAATVSGKLQR